MFVIEVGIMASRRQARGNSPQYRLGVQQILSNEARQEPSKLVAHLLQLMWVGHIPAIEVQAICAAAEADGLQHRDVRRYGSFYLKRRCLEGSFPEFSDFSKTLVRVEFH